MMNVIIVIIIIIQCIFSLIIIKMIMIRCDGLPQCPHHDDEEGCQLPDTARYALSLFIILITIYSIIIILSISYIIIRGAPNLVLIKWAPLTIINIIHSITMSSSSLPPTLFRADLQNKNLN